MKRVTLVVAVITILGLSANAQEAGVLRAGGGLAIGTEAALNDDGNETVGLGLNIGAEYFILDHISGAASYTLFFKSSVDLGPLGDFSLALNTINLDGRYYFYQSSPFGVYGIVGLSIASATAESTVNFFGVNQTVRNSDSEVGLNFGVGANMGLTDELGVNAQAIYNTPLEQAILNLGIFYRIM